MKIKRARKNKLFIAFIILSLFLFILIISINDIKLIKEATYSLPSLSLKNFVKVGVNVKPQTIIVKADCYELDMQTTNDQIDSIARALENTPSPRPNTHELFVYTLKNFGISPLFIKIHSLIDGSYLASTILKQNNKILVLDSRSSDAIAIALRLNVSVYINSSLLSYGRKIC